VIEIARSVARRVRTSARLRVRTARSAVARRWWRTQGRFGRTSFVHRLSPDVQIRLFLDSEFCRLFYLDGIEHGEIRFFRRFLRPGDVVLDVGANIGVFTLVSAAAVGPSGRVIAFEPAAETFARLLGNVELNGFANVRCVRSALSDRAGEATLASSVGGFDAWNSLADVPYTGGEFRRETVPVQTLDRFLEGAEIPRPVTLMKLDVEGLEARVLKGARRLLARDDAPVLQVEFTDAAAEAAGSSCGELYGLLVEYGFRMYRYDRWSDRLYPAPPCDAYPYDNLYAIKDADRVRDRVPFVE
jgi:FkbM family methyltransferase